MGRRIRATVGGLCVALSSTPAVAAGPPARAPVHYSLAMRAAGVQPYLADPSRFIGGVAYSEVQLNHDARNEPASRCTATGAGYWLGEMEDHGVIDNTDVHQRQPALGYVNNPTASRTFDPPADRYLGDFEMRPVLPAGPVGTAWASGCAPDHLLGGAVGADGETLLASVFRTASSGGLDPDSGAYVGTASAWAARSAKPNDGAALLRAYVQVTQLPDRNPRITYRITVVATADDDPAVRVDDQSWTIRGADVAADRLRQQFAEQLANRPGTVAALAGLGLRFAEPIVTLREPGVATVTAPALCTATSVPAGADQPGPAGLLASPEGVCFGVVQYEGSYQADRGRR